MLHGLDLFSGYGGLTLALSDWVKPVAFCEIDPYCRYILLSRMEDKKLPLVRIHDDIRNLDGKQYKGEVDIVYGGFPCQDISSAGTGKGLEGKRSGLFFELCRVVNEVKPTFVFLENVRAIRTRGLLTVVTALTDLRYDCRWTSISASEVGAPHIRERWFLLAYSNDKRGQHEHGRRRGKEYWEVQTQSRTYGKTSMGNTISSRGEAFRKRKVGENQKDNSTDDTSWWESEPSVGRVVDGCPFRVDRIKSLGNGVVPQQAKEAFKRLMGINVCVGLDK